MLDQHHRIVAESLVAVPDPLATALRPGPTASGAAVARALARSLAPEEDPVEPMPWLLPHQVRSCRRIVAALRRYGGAMLADPVGSGKTYVALAVAAVIVRAVNRSSPTTCLVPATLAAQWRTIAARLGVAVVVGTHQQASRARLPAERRGLVIIDESHHFRNPRTKRYHAIAPWLVGRPVLMLTATPIVNHLADLAAQLALAIRSDALAADGIASLPALFASGRSSPALGRLIFEQIRADERPRRLERVSYPHRHERTAARAAIDALSGLRLSCQPAIASLIRGVLGAAAASSPAAFGAALRRYRMLLRHAAEAAAAGRRVDRAAIRRFTEGQEEQLLLWELLSDVATSTELALDDLTAVDAVIASADRAALEVDHKLARLRALLADRRPTLVFTTRRATVRYLRDRLTAPNPGALQSCATIQSIAWCTGDRAGIGRLAAPRVAVWRCFGNDVPADSEPRILITTDVAAEGLDFRRVERVIHYDLPHTPMRLEQREGRAVRLGSRHAVIDVVQLAPAGPFERLLGSRVALTRKAKLPAAAGLGKDGARQWRWRTELAERYEAGLATDGVAAIESRHVGALAGFAIGGVATTVLWLERSTGEWLEAPDLIRARLIEAAESSHIRPVDSAGLHETLSALAAPIRQRLGLVAGSRWQLTAPDAGARVLAERLQPHVADAARRRDAIALRRLDRLLAFLASGHTAGEAALIARAAAEPAGTLLTAAARVPVRPPSDVNLEVRLVGLVLFGEG